MKQHFLIIFSLFILLSGCSTTPESPEITGELTDDQYQQQLSQLSNWQFKGKLAFITPKERQSANVLWQTHNQQLEKLSLSTFLGINILELEKQPNDYVIHVDDESHHGTNLSYLIWQLTGLTLPVNALNDWLKARPHIANDQLIYDQNNIYPSGLISDFNQQQWQVKYRQYRPVNQIMLPHKIDITQGQLSIKLQINRWEL